MDGSGSFYAPSLLMFTLANLSHLISMSKDFSRKLRENLSCLGKMVKRSNSHWQPSIKDNAEVSVD